MEIKHWSPEQVPGFPDISENLIEPMNNGITGDNDFNIFEYIGRPTADRGVRRKQNGGDKRRMGKLDALRVLMTIAGDSWERDLLMGSKGGSGAGNSGKSEMLCWTCHYLHDLRYVT